MGRHLALEFKATSMVTPHDLRGLKALREEGLVKRYAIVSLDEERRTIDGIEVWPWRKFLAELWNLKLFKPGPSERPAEDA